jgi:predicted DNA-binding transcriptional regulator AlpA
MNPAAQRPGVPDRGVAGENGFDRNPTLKIKPGPTRWIEPVLYGWREVVIATSHSQRLLEYKMARNEFPRPHMYSGRKPFWLASKIREWAERACCQ